MLGVEEDYRSPNEVAEQAGDEPLFPWYALRVRSNFERKASVSLREKGFTEFVPYYRAKRRWSDRTKILELPLFPGYVFCRLDLNRRLPILQTPGVVDLVRFGQDFIPIDEAEIRSIASLVKSGAEVTPWPYLRVGQRVRVRGGALDGVEGILLDFRNGRRIVVSITILQRSVAAELDRADVEPIL